MSEADAPARRLSVAIAGRTDPGRRRQLNEDFIGFDQRRRAAVLADGLGGHQSGEIAARMAVESVLDGLRELDAGRTGEAALRAAIVRMIADSNAKIHRTAESATDYRGMGSTVVACLVADGCVHVGHVGDSRLYRHRDRELERVTKDHSIVQDMIDRGMYTEAEARAASVSNIVTRALGIRDEVQVDAGSADLAPGDMLLLCSDGLSDMVPDWRIRELLNEGGGDLEGTVGTMVAAANANGGEDNISVILMRADG